jgi:catalase
MTTQADPGDPVASTRKGAMRGEFYKADQLVEAIHLSLGGYHPGFRAVHAAGRFYAGTFTANAAGRAFSRAAHFQGTPVPVTARFSYGSSDPDTPPTKVTAMATRFYLPDGTVTDLIGISLPAFPARTPDEVLQILDAIRPDAATSAPDLAKVQAFLSTHHPATARIAQLVQEQLAPVSFAQTQLRPLHAFRFIDADDVGRWARYHWEPEAGVAGQPDADLAQQPHNALFDEFERRLQEGPVAFSLDLQLAQDGDPLDDVTALWPDDRKRVTVGRLALTRPISLEEIGDPEMMHDPTKVTDGIEVSPDDQIMAARRGTYLISLAQRTGGWQRRSPVLADIQALPQAGG